MGTVPMGLATIINMIVLVCVPAWGNWAAQFAWALWWIDVVLSTSTCFYLPFVVMYVHSTQLSTMTAAWLLPIASTVVASATGGIVAAVLSNPQHALWTLILSYALWGMGMSLAMVVLVMYFHRLTVHKLPPRELIVSVFLPLGPVGQGGFAIQQLGKVARDIFPTTGSLIPGAGDTLYTMGFIVALILWGYGLVWLFFALASISRSRFPFNMGWWGFTFPLGVFAASTTQMAKEFPSAFFKVLGSIFSVIVVLLWLVVSARTIKGVITRTIFFAPCAAEYEKEFNARKARRDLERATDGKKQEKDIMKAWIETLCYGVYLRRNTLLVAPASSRLVALDSQQAYYFSSFKSSSLLIFFSTKLSSLLLLALYCLFKTSFDLNFCRALPIFFLNINSTFPSNQILLLIDTHSDTPPAAQLLCQLAVQAVYGWKLDPGSKVSFFKKKSLMS